MNFFCEGKRNWKENSTTEIDIDMKFSQNHLIFGFIVIILILILIDRLRKEKFLMGGVKNVGNPAYPIQEPVVPIRNPWMNETQVYEMEFWKWVKTQRDSVKERRKNINAPNNLPWAQPMRYPHGTLDRAFREDVDKIATIYWNQATRESGAKPGDSVNNEVDWSPFLRSFDWLRAESVWVADTTPVSNWKCYGIEGFVQDRMHFISYRIWMVVWVRWGQDLYGEPETNVPGTFYVGYPTPEQAARRTNVPLPTEVIPSGNDVLVSRPPVDPEPEEIRLWGIWVLDSTLTVDTHPLYTRNGTVPKIEYPWPEPGWADSSLESSTPPRDVLEKSTPWGEPAIVANQWIVPKGIPQDERAFPCGKIPSWTWDEWGISPEVAPKDLSCPWQTYALRPIPLRPSDTPTKAALPRDVGQYSWMFDAARGISQAPHGQGYV